MTPKKIIVIGAGIGGLAVAARLAKAGHDVEIFEASHQTGGKCRTEWIGDYAFDTGPSLLTLPAVYRDLFIKTGKRIEHILKLNPVDPAFDYHFADGTQLRFANLSIAKICQEIDRTLGRESGDQWHHLMQRAEKMWDASRGPFLESEMPSLLSLLRGKGALSALRTIAPLTSLRRYTAKYTNDWHLAQIIDRYATYTGSDPRKVPAVLLTIAFMESTFGAWHIEGGIGQLARALDERVRELGVRINLNTEISSITSHDGVATGVVTADGRAHLADIVIANADAQIVYNTLLPADLAVVKSERKKLQRAEKSLAGFSLLLGLDNSRISGAIPQLAHHTVYFPENYDQEFDEIFTKKIPVTDPTIYICAPSDPAMVRGENKEAWFVLINAPRHEPGIGYDWNIGTAEYAEKIIAQLDALGLRVSERLDVMEIRTPLDLQNSVMAPGGSIYGTSSNSARSAFLRAANRSPLKNLYCVGGSAHPGGGLPLVGMSAELVSQAVVDDN
jgi:phytoene desaturase